MSCKTDEKTENDITCDDIETQIRKYCQNERKHYSTAQQLALVQMTQMGYTDQIMNQFKLSIYNWNISKAIEYYETDQFCHEYCISEKDTPYGCTKPPLKCPFRHSFSIDNLTLEKDNYQMGKLLCLYLMYKKVYNQNAALFVAYAGVLMSTMQHENDLLAERFLVTALSMDNKYKSGHLGYATLLAHKLDENEKALVYLDNAGKLSPNDSVIRYFKGTILFELNRKDESVVELQLALALNKTDNQLSLEQMQICKEKIDADINSNDIPNFNGDGVVDDHDKSVNVAGMKNDTDIDGLSFVGSRSRINEIDCELEKIVEVIKNSKDKISFDLKSGLLNDLKNVKRKINEIKNINKGLKQSQVNLLKLQDEGSYKSTLANIDNYEKNVSLNYNENLKPVNMTVLTDMRMQHFKPKMEKIKQRFETCHNYNRTESTVAIASGQSNIKEMKNEIQQEKEKIENEIATHFNIMMNDLNKYWNNLNVDNIIDSFESKWTQWSIDDTLTWFDYVLKCKNKNNNNYNNKNNYNSNPNSNSNALENEIEFYSTDESDDDDDDEDDSDYSGNDHNNNNDDDNNADDEKKVEILATTVPKLKLRFQVDYKKVRNLLIAINFRAKKNLPLMLKSFQFKQFGFKNIYHCKLLCKQTKLLIQKYPKKKVNIRQKTNNCRCKNNKKNINQN